MTTNPTTTPELGEFNVEALRGAVAWAEYEVEKAVDTGHLEQYEVEVATEAGHWDQGTWMAGRVTKRPRVDTQGNRYLQVSCGTAFCIAGAVCRDQGDVFVVEPYMVNEGGTVDAEKVIPKGQRDPVAVEHRAEELLGIDFEEARRLFDSENTIEDVRELAEEIAGRRGQVL